MSNWLDICSVDDLQPNSGVCALVNGEQIAIFYMPEEAAVYAIGNFDPIGKAYVLSRGMIGDVGGLPVVASPLYKQHYDLQTGQCIEDETVKVNAYPIRINGDRVELDAEAKAA